MKPGHRSFHAGLLLAALLLASPGITAAQSADDDESDKDSQKTERASHELGHVVQQRQGVSTGRAAKPAPATPATQGDPDRPVITGRMPNPASSDDRPTETLSLNYEKISVSSVKVKSTQRQRSRVVVRGWDNTSYALPDGTYAGDAGQGIVVSGGAVREKSSGDVVVKGKKILQNYLPDGKFVGPGGAWIEVANGRIASVGGQLERQR